MTYKLTTVTNLVLSPLRNSHIGEQKRWLGRGVAPSQPSPAWQQAGKLQRKNTQIITPLTVIAGIAALLAIGLICSVLFSRWQPAKKSLVLHPVMSAFAQSAASIDPMELLLSGTGDMKISTDLLTIEKVWVDSCHRSATRPNLAPIGQCDRQPSFERALVRAVIQGAECMPEKPKDETVSFALEINHSAKTTRLFPGRSGSLGVTQSKPVVACVLQKFAEPAWDNAPRDHSRYVIGVLARYHAQKRQ